MNIRLLTSRFLPDSVGGGETHALEVAKQMGRLGHDVRVWRTAIPGSPTGDYEFQQVRVEMIPTAVSGGSVATSGAWLERKLAQAQVDVVHVMVGGGCEAMMLAAATKRLPLVVTFLDFHYWCSQALRLSDGTLCAGPESVEGCHQCLLRTAGRVHLMGGLWRGLPRGLQRLSAKLPRMDTLETSWRRLEGEARFFGELCRAGTTFVAPSPIMRRLAERAGVPRDRIVDLPYGVPESFIGAAREKRPSKPLRVGFFGRLVPEKGVHVLIEAVSAVPKGADLVVRIHGGGQKEYVEEVSRLAAADSRIQLCGVLDHARLPEEHTDLDVVVIPSLWQENATIVLLESLALGTPVIVSDVEGMAPFIRPGLNGFTFPVGNVRELTSRLVWCVDNRDQLATMAAECRPTLSAETHATTLQSVYAAVSRSVVQAENVHTR